MDACILCPTLIFKSLKFSIAHDIFLEVKIISTLFFIASSRHIHTYFKYVLNFPLLINTLLAEKVINLILDKYFVIAAILPSHFLQFKSIGLVLRNNLLKVQYRSQLRILLAKTYCYENFGRNSL